MKLLKDLRSPGGSADGYSTFAMFFFISSFTALSQGLIFHDSLNGFLKFHLAKIQRTDQEQSHLSGFSILKSLMKTSLVIEGQAFTSYAGSNGYIEDGKFYLTQVTPAVNGSNYFDDIFLSVKDAEDGKKVITEFEVLKTDGIEHTVKARTILNNRKTSSDIALVIAEKESVFGSEDPNPNSGLAGYVYRLPEGIQQLPNLDLLTPISTIYTEKIDVPVMRYETGFPGVPDLFEWFAISYRGRIMLPKSGTYEFRLASDDGSKLFIDSDLVVNNDSTQEVTVADGQADFTSGIKNLRLDYFQGPRWEVALQLYWKKPGDDHFEIVPENALRLYKK
ncbi:PA14 domain-containing protein [Pseudobacteriovorax antillogorgiicola]|uniref:PA14 domain-containing protein n=1 Tax=Pseudobacteriovorax antillogorgiicola TaxID=1513793 RepID=A0A1Y6C8G6_9BACT|nr:PA14 domain-containing protein [Pseudobacteriovorax antillogorgiicola]TCS49781.1 PA14 domain-containing protein [Pseudobacteriovorax antillogorgiicola]SMF42830.1 PA14 domain-containing protein [Pseudobacteriovorax antillogorgiicola]